MPRRGGRLRRIFVGSAGLRSGWSLLLFFLIAFGLIVAQALALWAAFGIRPMPKNPIALSSMAAREATFVIGALAATAIMARIERRPAAAYGFARRGAGAGLATGFAVGALVLSVLVGVLRLAGYYHIVIALPGAARPLAFGAGWLLVFLLVGLSEEAMMRGYPLFRLWRTAAYWRAALVMGLVFAGVHIPNAGESVVGIVEVLVAALTFSAIIWRTGTLWVAIGLHAGWDWAQSFLWGTPDSGLVMQGHWLTATASGPALISGGATGPEGSVLAAPALLLGLGVVWAVVPRRAPAAPASGERSISE